MPTVHLVDDDDSFRTAVSRLLRLSGYDVHVYTSAGDFLIQHLADDASPACLLLDVSMPGPSGLDLQAALAERNIALPVIFATGHGDIPMTVRALKAGATDFLAKPIDPKQLLDSISEAIARDVARRDALEQRRALESRYEELTEREREVLTQLLAGRINKQIAMDIGVSERTVKSHRANLLAKMGSRTIAELVRAAVDLGLVPENAPPPLNAGNKR